ncbi:DctP family TRAP transporter solute-binding subunit [Desulfosarcina ovata]|uniref:C4-dicarboxylate ABC transporter n=1 Tax=Desulfosarcina ovata subsp. ovata TaxID=2752305 RepID=A0A5K8AAX7_9BACT|nr:DctP family TRAP transporter solute-binding subunit [Desulfosarcina ovata]BBO89747.1 C4-dicarboxylate ABC transporter [Desulfosarcina ovata subsp. ovata]
MTTMKRAFFHGLVSMVAVMVLALFMTPFALAAGFKREYKLQVNVGPSFYWGIGATKFADLVREKTDGQINIKPYFGSALLKGAQLKSAQMVAKGVIDCAYESTINISPVIPEANIFHLPFFINTFENLDKMKAGQSGQAVFAAMRKIGLQPLAWAENGFRQVTNSKHPIGKPADLKGLRIRVVGNPMFMDTFRQLGADPVNMNWGDAQTAFQQGVVDGQENPVGVLIPVQIHQYHRYATMWNYLVDPLVIYWNQKQWKAFPSDIRQAIQEAAQTSGRFEIALCRAGLDGNTSLDILKNEFNHTMEVPDPVQFMESKGMTVSFLSTDQVKAFADATAPVLKKWARKLGTDLVDKARADMGR